MCGFTAFRRHARWTRMMGWPPFATADELRLALLAAIAEEPASGYELIRKIGERAGGYYRARAQTVYPTLQQLEDEGLIGTEIREARRVYRVAEAGLHELQQRADEVQDLWRSRGARHWYRSSEAAAADIRDAAEHLARTVRRTLADELSPERIARVREILQRAARDLENEFRARH